jgi:hypothetical protein
VDQAGGFAIAAAARTQRVHGLVRPLMKESSKGGRASEGNDMPRTARVVASRDAPAPYGTQKARYPQARPATPTRQPNPCSLVSRRASVRSVDARAGTLRDDFVERVLRSPRWLAAGQGPPAWADDQPFVLRLRARSLPTPKPAVEHLTKPREHRAPLWVGQAAYSKPTPLERSRRCAAPR